MTKAVSYFCHIVSLVAQVSYVHSCLSGGRTSLRGRPGRISNREPLIYGQYIPNRSETSVSASGPATERITRDSPRYEELVENNNIDIVFKDEEKTRADRMMSNRCKDKLDSLAIMVMNQWPEVKLRVIEGWDEDGVHAEDSLHYDGRAVDITTSDKDRSKLPLLARLAYDAGFDYVSFESKHHIHCSVKSDEEYNMMNSGLDSGCFAAGSYVTMADGSRKLIEDLQINDRVLSISSETGEIIADEVYMFLDRNPFSKNKFVKLTFEGGDLTLTSSHLLYASADSNASFPAAAPIYASQVTKGGYIFVNVNNSLIQQEVLNVTHVLAEGYYAPLTFSGNIVVNEVFSSCYASINRHWLAHWALSPLRLLHKYFGAIMQMQSPEVQTGVHWYANVLMYTFPFLLS